MKAWILDVLPNRNYFVRQSDGEVFFEVNLNKYASEAGEEIAGSILQDILWEDIAGYTFGDDIARERREQEKLMPEPAG